jgi:hypothetical protein
MRSKDQPEYDPTQFDEDYRTRLGTSYDAFIENSWLVSNGTGADRPRFRLSGFGIEDRRLLQTHECFVFRVATPSTAWMVCRCGVCVTVSAADLLTPALGAALLGA